MHLQESGATEYERGNEALWGERKMINLAEKRNRRERRYSALTGKEKTEILKTPLLNGLDRDLQEGLMEKAMIHQWRKGEFLFFDGESIDAMHYVLRGKAREYYCNAEGDECLRFLHQEGSHISLHHVCTELSQYTYSCEALTTLVCVSWLIEDLKSLQEQSVCLACRMAQLLSHGVEDSCRHICLCRKTQALSRVAGYLLSRKPLGTALSPLPLHLVSAKKAQANLKPLCFSASDICLARETFSRALSSLQEQKLISVEQGTLQILDEDGLKRVSGIV